MGLFKGPKDNTDKLVAEQKRDEEERQRKISAANDRITGIFSNFNPEFFGKAADDYVGYYRPIADEQYKDNARMLTFDLANKGLTASTSAGRRRGVLQTSYNRALDKISSDASSFRKGLEGDVAGAESDLRGLAQAGVDPSSVANMATSRARLLSQPPAFDPLTDFFEQYAGQQLNRKLAGQAGYTPRSIIPPLRFGSGGGSSVRTVI